MNIDEALEYAIYQWNELYNMKYEGVNDVNFMIQNARAVTALKMLEKLTGMYYDEYEDEIKEVLHARRMAQMAKAPNMALHHSPTVSRQHR